MPVPASPPWRIYDDLGLDAARDLIRWFSELQAAHRAELRSLEDRVDARMDSTVALRIAECEASNALAVAQVELRLTRWIGVMVVGLTIAFAFCLAIVGDGKR
jgi:hypothetical protein